MEKNKFISKIIICFVITQINSYVFGMQKKRKRRKAVPIRELVNPQDISVHEAKCRALRKLGLRQETRRHQELRKKAESSQIHLKKKMCQLRSGQTKKSVEIAFCNSISLVVRSGGAVPFENTPFYKLYLQAETNPHLASLISSTFSIDVDFSQINFYYLVMLILQGKNLPCTKTPFAQDFLEKQISRGLRMQGKRTRADEPPIHEFERQNSKRRKLR